MFDAEHPTSCLMPHLKLVEKGAHKTYRIDGTEAVVGRDPTAGIVVEGDSAKTVSGRHARFFIDDGRWFVEDTGSRNGTYVGSRKLDAGARHALAVGETVGLGLTGTQFTVEEAVGRVGYAAPMLAPPPAVAPPPPRSPSPPPASRPAAHAPQEPLASGTMPMRRSEALRVGIHDPGGIQSQDEARVIFRYVQGGI